MCFAKSESSLFTKHIADSHGLSLSSNEVQMSHAGFGKERPNALEWFSDRPFPEPSEYTAESSDVG